MFQRMRTATFVSIEAMILLCLPTGSFAASCNSEQGASRQTIFISDLHMGVGHDFPGGAWNATEDFRWEGELGEFLREMDKKGEGETDLVIVGDLFELWQSTTGECSHDDPNLGCSEQEALMRTKRVLSEHAAALHSIGHFASGGNNRVHILVGNHDSALLYKSITAAVLAAINAPEGRVCIIESGYWLSSDGLIYAEHGHQIPGDANSFDEWPQPFLIDRATGQKHLQRSWGERFVQKYYNQYENKYSIIDNIAEEWAGVRLAAKVEGATGLSEAFGNGVRFLLFQLSWKQIAQGLGDPKQGGDWDVEYIRKELGDRFIVESFFTDDPLRELAENALQQHELKINISDLGDDEIRALCDYRQADSIYRQYVGRAVRVAPCPKIGGGLGDASDDTLGAVTISLLRSRDQRFRKYLESIRENLRKEKPGLPDFEVFVFGHTHGAQAGFFPFGNREGWSPKVVNSGAWQRLVTPEKLEEIRENRKLSEKDILLEMTPENLPDSYSFIIVPKYEKGSKPQARLSYWGKDSQMQ